MKKNKFNKYLLGAAVVALGGLASCEDYLTLYPTDSITKEDYWNTANDVDNVRAAAYYQMTQQLGKILIWGEFRSDNVTLNKMDKTEYLRLQEAVLQPTQEMFDWAGFYTGINYCNEVLENGQRMIDEDIDPSFTEGDWLPIKAEMLSLRSLYYFYLVRAYRDVPYVTKSVSTDTEAKASRIAATPGYEILDKCIEEVEAAKAYAAKNFGAGITGTGRFTTYSMSALLADMYLWRACLYNHLNEKKNASGEPYTEENTDQIVKTSLEKCIGHCDIVLDRMKSEYNRRLDLQGVLENDRRRKQPFPLYLNTVATMGMTTDMPYYYNFGQGNSQESVFELQFDGVNSANKYYGEMFYGENDNGTLEPGIMTAAVPLFSSLDKADPEMGFARGFGRTDFRYASTVMYLKPGQNVFPIYKNVVTGVMVEDATDMSKGSDFMSIRLKKNSYASGHVYRLSDIMLIKSEAIARLVSVNGTASASMGYHLINNLFARNNPAADSINTESQLYCPRLAKGWASVHDNFCLKDNSKKEACADSLLRLTYCERQREFIAEGKRWFDIVRECEWRNATEDVLSDIMMASNSVKNRCRNIWALYNPIYSDEMKVNGVGYGDGLGKLVQNPVWQKYMQD